MMIRSASFVSSSSSLQIPHLEARKSEKFRVVRGPLSVRLEDVDLAAHDEARRQKVQEYIAASRNVQRKSRGTVVCEILVKVFCNARISPLLGHLNVGVVGSFWQMLGLRSECVFPWSYISL